MGHSSNPQINLVDGGIRQPPCEVVRGRAAAHRNKDMLASNVDSPWG